MHGGSLLGDFFLKARAIKPTLSIDMILFSFIVSFVLKYRLTKIAMIQLTLFTTKKN